MHSKVNLVAYILFLISTCYILVTLIIFYDERLSYAQWIMQPLPLPGSAQPDCCGVNLENDTTPPKIIITTDILYEGNNVLKLKIEDESPLKLRGINFTQGDRNIETYLAKEQNQQYNALVKVVSPITEIQVRAVDVHDNAARLVQQIKVVNWFDNMVSSIASNPIWKMFNPFGENR